ncbi:MAG: PIN domain-containing protein [bacterium]
MGELYDTTVFIDYWRGDQGARALVERARLSPKSATYSPLSAMELWQYPRLTRKEEIEYVALTLFLREAPVTTSIGRQAGQWLRGGRRRDRMRLAADALVAATAQETGDTVRTRNVADISKFYSRVQPY